MKARVLWLAVASLAVAGCVRDEGSSGGESGSTGGRTGPIATAATKGPNDRLKVAVVPKGTTHQFWQTVKAGAEAAGKEFNAEVLWNGPKSETDIQDQVDIVTGYKTMGVDGVALAATDKHTLVDTVKSLEAAGIPVVTIDSGIDPDVSRSFIATNNVEAAKLAAQEMGRRLNGKGKVAVLTFLKGAGTSDEREKGFLDGIKAFPGITVVGVEETKSDVGKARDKMETLLTANPDLAGVFAANEPNVVGAAPVLEERKLAGRVLLIGFDASDAEIGYLKKGTVQAVVVQDPFKMGYEGVKAIAGIARGKGNPPRSIDTGARVVTKENMDTPEMRKILYPLGPPR